MILNLKLFINQIVSRSLDQMKPHAFPTGAHLNWNEILYSSETTTLLKRLLFPVENYFAFLRAQSPSIYPKIATRKSIRCAKGYSISSVLSESAGISILARSGDYPRAFRHAVVYCDIWPYQRQACKWYFGYGCFQSHDVRLLRELHEPPTIHYVGECHGLPECGAGGL